MAEQDEEDEFTTYNKRIKFKNINNGLIKKHKQNDTVRLRWRPIQHTNECFIYRKSKHLLRYENDKQKIN